METVRTIECVCGEWEELPVDSPRHHVDCFEHVKNIGNEALYKCPCGKKVKSKVVNHELPT